MSQSLKIRRFTRNDLSFADSIRRSAGWNQILADWKRLIRYEPSGCFVAEWEGASAGTVTTTRYGNELAWIGMMIVHPDFRRRGIATALMKSAIEYLQASGVSCIKLDATPDGAPVYERLGFQSEYELHRWVGEPSSPDESSHQDELPLPLGFDAEMFGADRSRWLTLLAEGATTVRVLRNRDGEPTAYGMVRPGNRANYLGPITAVDSPTGREVTEQLLKRMGGLTFWDIPEANADAIQLAEAYGFKRLRPLLRMWMGKKCTKGKPFLQFGLGDPGTG